MADKKLRVLLIHQYFLEKNDAGGSRWNEMAAVWEGQGHEITVLAGMIHGHKTEKYSKYKGKFIAEEQYSNKIRVVRCHVSETYNVSFLGRLWAYFSFVFSSLMASVIKLNNKFDIIVVSSPPLFVGITAYLISFFKKVPYVFEIRDLWPASAIDTGVLKNKTLIKISFWFECFMYKNARLINVLTPAFKENLINQKGISKHKICLIPNAADFSLSDNLLESFDALSFKKELCLEDKFVVTYVGAHGVANGLSQVLETAKILKETNVMFLLIGDGMLKKELKKMALLENIKNVKFIDSVSKLEVFKYILASDMGASVLVKNDTFKTVYSNKTFDYMSCKKPILMAIDGVSRELVEKSKSGIFVEPENPKDFADKIRIYMDNPNLVLKQGENGYKFAKIYFDRSILAKEYIENIKECIRT
jgi:glycosyltransferase involved in cell wall biosynthesis